MRGWGTSLSAVAVVVITAGTLSLFGAASAQAVVGADAQTAAAIASAAGYRTGIGVLDLQTGAYYGAGQDTAGFASESVAKIFIATELLLTGQMAGSTQTLAYQMITQSDDDDADALYGLAGGDDVINRVAAHYNLPTLGTAPSEPGWWGNTEINAKALVYLYAAIAKDPVVGPWLMNAMANATEYGADGTYQFFGIPSATTGAAIKQGWGDDGDDSPNAVFNSTGYVDGGTFAVAILTDGPPSSYGSVISGMVTTEAKALMPGGQIDDPAKHNPVITGVAATTTGSTVHITGSATDPDTTASLDVTAAEMTDSTGDAPAAIAVASGSTAADHTFDLSFRASNGSHTYVVSVANAGEGTAGASATTAALTVDGSPAGTVTSVTGGPGTVIVTGQELNPNLSPGEAPAVTVTIDGRVSITESALSDYRLVIPATAGHDTVTVTYLGSDGAPSVTEGTWPVIVAETPTQRTEARWRIVIAAAAGVLVLVATGLMLWRRLRRHRPDQPRAATTS